MEHDFLVFLLTVAVAGAAAQWLGWRFGVPAIVLLLAAGLAVGPGVGLIDPSRLLGELLQPLIGVGVAIIVFEGGLSLDIREFRAAGTGISRLVVLALPLNWLFAAVAAHWIGELSWPVAIVVGAILVVTGPTVILPLIRQNALRQRPAALLKWEAVVNDPLGAALAVVALEYFTVSAAAGEGASVFGSLAAGWLFALVTAVAAGYAVRYAFHADLVPEVMKTPVLLSAAIALYAAGNLAQHEAGLLAATVFGVTLANIGIRGLKPLSRYKESLSLLLVSGLFVILAADLDAAVFQRMSWNVIGLVAALLAVRPAAILLATIRSGLSWRERLLSAWIGPRGIVAAAIAGIAGARLSAAGYADGDLVLPVVFLMVAATVVTQGLTLRWLARRLDLVSTERPGLLIVGASPWTIELATVLRDLGMQVILADRSSAALSPARRHGIEVMNVEILSEWVEEALDAGGIAYLIAATEDDAYNALVCARLAPELGRERVHQMALQSGLVDSRHGPAPDWRGRIMVEPTLDLPSANRLLDEGWGFRVRRVEAGEGDATAAEVSTDRDKLVMAVQDSGGLLFHTPEREVTVTAGDHLIIFGPPQKGRLPEEPQAAAS